MGVCQQAKGKLSTVVQIQKYSSNKHHKQPSKTLPCVLEQLSSTISETIKKNFKTKRHYIINKSEYSGLFNSPPNRLWDSANVSTKCTDVTDVINP